MKWKWARIVYQQNFYKFLLANVDLNIMNIYYVVQKVLGLTTKERKIQKNPFILDKYHS